MSCLLQSYADQHKIKLVDFFRSLSPARRMEMPVGEFRKALLQVRWVLAAAGSECVRMRVRMHTHARVCVCMCMFVSIKVCYVHIPTPYDECY